MNKAILILALAALFQSCSKSSDLTSTPPAGVTVTTITSVYFELPDASGNPTRMYVKNTNTGASPFVLNIKPSDVYSLRFSGLAGNAITGTPRTGSTNVVGFNAGVGDTMILLKGGVETIKAVLANDNLDILNGGIFAERFGSETNAQAGTRINAYTTGNMLSQKFEKY